MKVVSRCVTKRNDSVRAPVAHSHIMLFLW